MVHWLRLSEAITVPRAIALVPLGTIPGAQASLERLLTLQTQPAVRMLMFTYSVGQRNQFTNPNPNSNCYPTCGSGTHRSTDVFLLF